MKILTYNIRCAWIEDGVNSFLHRAGMMLEKISKESPDIIAFQEVTDPILAFLRRHLNGYTIIGHGRYGNYNGEGVFTAFKNTVSLINFDTYWLSPTPYIPASRYEIQSGCPRTCVDALFMYDNKLIRVINVHLDHVSDSARILGINQILENVKKKQKDIKSYVAILGDFNATPESETIKACNDSGLVDITKEIPISFHAYTGVTAPDQINGLMKKLNPNPRKIDYIYLDSEAAKTARNVQLYTDSQDGIYLSDHYPISAEIL